SISTLQYGTIQRPTKP
ncbi:unnamed protein product, partial [Rotaria sordida]